MPDTRLILHVKGTESEFTELPMQAVREALSQGQLSPSQLIWSAPDHAWKQAKDFPGLLPEEELILHVKGTQQETKQLPKEAVRAAISQGQITHSQLIWSPSDHEWKQVRELPHLLPSQKMAPVAPRAAANKTAESVVPDSPTGPVARAADKATVPAGEKVQPRAAGPILVRSTGSLEVQHHEEGFHPLKWLCIGLSILIVVMVGWNYIYVNEPVVSKMSQTPYAKVPVYAHLGAFFQPNVLVIHVPSNTIVTPDNLGDFLSALARSTPKSPMTSSLFDRVALTSGWTAQYSFSGTDWKQLGDMSHSDSDTLRDFLLAEMEDAGGATLLPPSTLNPEAQQAKRDQVWQGFLSHFAPKSRR